LTTKPALDTNFTDTPSSKPSSMRGLPKPGSGGDLGKSLSFLDPASIKGKANNPGMHKSMNAMDSMDAHLFSNSSLSNGLQDKANKPVSEYTFYSAKSDEPKANDFMRSEIAVRQESTAKSEENNSSLLQEAESRRTNRAQRSRSNMNMSDDNLDFLDILGLSESKPKPNVQPYVVPEVKPAPIFKAKPVVLNAIKENPDKRTPENISSLKAQELFIHEPRRNERHSKQDSEEELPSFLLEPLSTTGRRRQTPSFSTEAPKKIDVLSIIGQKTTSPPIKLAAPAIKIEPPKPAPVFSSPKVAKAQLAEPKKEPLANSTQSVPAPRKISILDILQVTYA
jgi:hypothetical protein